MRAKVLTRLAKLERLLRPKRKEKVLIYVDYVQDMGLSTEKVAYTKVYEVGGGNAQGNT